jgi:mono/diheme cytochrome c family protein
MALRPDDSLFAAIAAGGWTMDRSAEMPAFAGSLDPAEMRALVGYIRALCRCAQPAWAESAP